MKVGITGYKGMLGSELVRLGGIPLKCDITKRQEVRAALEDVNPNVVIHCAAVTDVDGCELEKYIEASKVNFLGTAILKEECTCNIVYISTDYIFDGKDGAYCEFDYPNPINRYGTTKLHGEYVIQSWLDEDIVVRTTVLYGDGERDDFVSKVVQQLEDKNYFSVPTTLYGSPTYVPHLAEALMELCSRDFSKMPRIINIAGDDVISRYEFAKMIADVFGYDSKYIKPLDTFKDMIAKRPRNAGLVMELAEELGLPIYSALDGLLTRKSRSES